MGKITRHNKKVTYAIRLEKVEHGFIFLSKIEKRGSVQKKDKEAIL